MAPSFDCMVNLFCDDDSIWENEVVSHNDEENVVQEPLNNHVPDFPIEDDAVIAVFVQKETYHMPQEDFLERFSSLHLDAASRWEAIRWIFKVQAQYRFGPLTTYLSVNYLDRFLSSHQLPQGNDWMLQLLSVACVSLAAKMEEPEVPLLLDLQVGEVKYFFEARTIQRMELLILSILKWRLSSVTPFSYVGYLLHKIGLRFPFCSALVLRISELIMATFRFPEFSLHRPSAIAIASVIGACEEFFVLKADSYRETLLCALSVSEEICGKCYERMHELVIDPFWTSKKAMVEASGKSSSIPAPGSPAGVLDAAACPSLEDSDQSGKTTSLESNAAGIESRDAMVAGSTAAKGSPMNKRKFTQL